MSRLRFPQQEFDRRGDIVRKMMGEEGLDLLVVFSAPGSMRYGQRGHVMYLSGYEPYFGNTMMLLAADEGIEPLLMIDSADYFPSTCTWVTETEGAQDPVGVIGRYLERNRMANASLGVAGEYSIDPKLMVRLNSEMRGGSLKLASRILERARAIKSPYEVDCITDAVSVAEKGFEALREHARPGVSEAVLVGEVEKACRQAGSEAFPHNTMVTSGTNQEHLDLWWYCGSRKLKANDVFNLDIGTMCNGYCSDIARSFSLGSASRESVHAYDVLAEAFETARKMCRPGVRASAVNEAVTEVMAEEFEGDFSGIGHGVGLEVHEWPFIGYEYIRNDPVYEDSVLEEGMVISIEPQITLQGHGYIQLEDEIVVTGAGGRTMSALRHEIVEC